MRKYLFFLALSGLLGSCATGQQPLPTPPAQPADGYGGASYPHDEVIQRNYDDGPTGFWLYLPAQPRPAVAPLVVFLHGYGGWNPGNYGAWIRHLVRRGNIVLFPRYQEDFRTPPRLYTEHAARAIQRALDTLRGTEPALQVRVDSLLLLGHSYGGVVAANLALRAEVLGIPPSRGLFLAAAGAGPAPQGQADSYAALPASLRLLLLIEAEDTVVGSTFMDKVFREAPSGNKIRLIHQPDGYGLPPLTASHREATGVDTAFDSRDGPLGLARSRVDAVDYYVYWRLADALIGGSLPNQTTTASLETWLDLGTWSDGTPVRRLSNSP